MNLNRRTFVTGSALASASLVAAGALAAPAVAEETAAAASPCVPAWLGPEPQIAPEQIVRTDACDVLIVGAGCAGIAAAATASDLGLNYICCDKGAVVPESREYLGAVNTMYSLQVAEPVDTGKLLNELVRYASGKCDRDLIKLWIDNSAEMIEWIDPMLAAAGKPCVVSVPPAHETGGTDYMTPVLEHAWMVPYVPPTRNELLYSHVCEAGGQVRFGWELVKLVHAEGAVTGAIFETDEGYVQIDAAHTILATGGYAGNPQMMQALQPDAVGCCTAASYNSFCDGSGIKAGLWAGAAKEADPTPMIFDRGAVEPGVDAGYVEQDGRLAFPGKIYQLNIGSQPFLKVNRRGQRFANESTPYDTMMFATARQPGGVFCQVFDGNAAADIVRFGMIGCASYTTMMMAQGMPVEEFVAMTGGAEVLKKADTLEELAEMLGFDAEAKETFLATCARYNELFDAQDDMDYGKEAYRLSELRTPPFYGCWYGGSLLTTLDGLKIDAKMRVLDANYQAIPGLYAIGDCSGGFFNTNYPEYIVGVAAGRSVTEGRQVVKMIAADPAFVATEPVVQEAAGEQGGPVTYKDGVYTGTGQGMGGDINVTLQIENGVVTVLEIGPNNETEGMPGHAAIADGTYKAMIEAAQGSDIDAIAAATVTTAAIERAVKKALAQAAA